jgi:hypothetical protein
MRVHSHRLDEITGHVVVQTITPEGVMSHQRGGQGDVVYVVEGSTRYLEALNIAKMYRKGKAWAVVRSLHGCAECDPIVLSGREPHVVQSAAIKKQREEVTWS